jgi:hypothetical protein
VPARQKHWLGAPEGAISDTPLPINPSAPLVPPPIYAEQFFLLALTDPSLQMKVLPWQCDMPPFPPLHGEFASASGDRPNATAIADTQINARAANLICCPQRPSSRWRCLCGKLHHPQEMGKNPRIVTR